MPAGFVSSENVKIFWSRDVNKLLSLYLQSLVTTTILAGIKLTWIGYRALKKKDKTAKQRQAHLYDIL